MKGLIRICKNRTKGSGRDIYFRGTAKFMEAARYCGVERVRSEETKGGEILLIFTLDGELHPKRHRKEHRAEIKALITGCPSARELETGTYEVDIFSGPANVAILL